MISCKLELVKIGVAGDAQKRLRELQVGSAAVGLTTRTLGNWKAAPAFHCERERQHKRAARQRAAPPSSKAKPPARQDAQNKQRERAGEPHPAAPQPDRPPAHPASSRRSPSRRPRSTSNTLSATVRLWPPRSKPTALTRRARDPPTNTTPCRSSRIRATGTPLGSPTTRHASSTTRRTRCTSTTTRNAATSRQPSAALANDATTALPDRATATKRVALPPNCDNDSPRTRRPTTYVDGSYFAILALRASLSSRLARTTTSDLGWLALFCFGTHRPNRTHQVAVAHLDLRHQTFLAELLCVFL